MGPYAFGEKLCFDQGVLFEVEVYSRTIASGFQGRIQNLGQEESLCDTPSDYEAQLILLWGK